MTKDDVRNQIINDYFEWLSDLVCRKRYSSAISYRKLLMLLHSIEFRYLIPNDKNRASDGISLRWRFACDRDMSMVPTCLDGPCSVLEMMVALAIRCEEDIMDDPHHGNRTGQWFWGMIVNLGLGSMYDEEFDKHKAIEIIDRFLDRKYEPNGKGGLFTIRNCDRDIRKIEIWYQLRWYLDNIV